MRVNQFLRVFRTRRSLAKIYIGASNEFIRQG